MQPTIFLCSLSLYNDTLFESEAQELDDFFGKLVTKIFERVSLGPIIFSLKKQLKIDFSLSRNLVCVCSEDRIVIN